MKTYTGLRNLYGTLTKDTTSGNLTLGDELINDCLRRIMSAAPWDFLERSRTDSTVASTQFYQLPSDYDKLIEVTVTIGSTTYTPKEVPDRETWNALNRTTVKSDTPLYFHIFNNQLGFYPTPASSTSNAITYIYRRKFRDLSFADYSTGNIDIITNASASVTGAGSPGWTVPMAGRFLRVTPSNTAAANGDGLWYEISSVGSSTTITLVKKYLGTSLTTGAAAAYIIGDMSALPESYHDIPVYDAAAIYWMYQGDMDRTKFFYDKFVAGFKQLRADHLSKTTDTNTEDIDIGDIINPNLTISL